MPQNKSFEENTSYIYERILINCWQYEPFFRPNITYLNEIFYNYFDVIEPNYNFSCSEKIVAKKFNIDLLEEIVEAKAENEINLGILLQAGNFSEIWTGNYFLKQLEIFT